jgi:DNA replication protein DnaC
MVATMRRIDFSAVLKRVEAIREKNPDLYKYKKELIDKENQKERLEAIEYELSRSGLPCGASQQAILPKNNAQRAVIDMLNSIDILKDPRLPYIYGRPGTGKSIISIRYAHKLIQSGIKNVRFFSLSEFLIRSRVFEDNVRIDEILDPFVVILDDFCSHNVTKHSIEMLHAIVDFRLRNRKPTMITSNIAIDNISNFLYTNGKRSGVSKILCEAIEDRIYELCVRVTLQSKSHRRQ